MNQKELNYPKLYAPMPVDQTEGYDSLGYPINRTYAYISAPCYVISERKRYQGDGTNVTEYEVVFCKKIKDSSHFEVEAVEPHFNYELECINSIVVSEIDTDYKRMKQICEEKSIDTMISNNIHLPIQQLQKQCVNYQIELNRINQQFEQACQSTVGLTKKKQ